MQRILYRRVIFQHLWAKNNMKGFRGGPVLFALKKIHECWIALFSTAKLYFEYMSIMNPSATIVSTYHFSLFFLHVVVPSEANELHQSVEAVLTNRKALFHFHSQYQTPSPLNGQTCSPVGCPMHDPYSHESFMKTNSKETFSKAELNTVFCSQPIKLLWKRSNEV